MPPPITPLISEGSMEYSFCEYSFCFKNPVHCLLLRIYLQCNSNPVLSCENEGVELAVVGVALNNRAWLHWLGVDHMSERDIKGRSWAPTVIYTGVAATLIESKPR